jgi:hypothetical protein
MTDAEFVLRFLALAQTWEKFQGDLRGALDDFMQRNRFPARETLESYRHNFQTCITTAEAIWRGWAFKRPYRDQVLSGLYDAQMIALLQIGFNKHDVLIRRRDEVTVATDALFQDSVFDEAVRLGTNTPARLRTRIITMTRTLRGFTREPS